MNKQKDKEINKNMDKWMNSWMDKGCINGCINGWINIWIDGKIIKMSRWLYKIVNKGKIMKDESLTFIKDVSGDVDGAVIEVDGHFLKKLILEKWDVRLFRLVVGCL